jgi:tetrahydromethanopterin S-methyltransferase subunit G
MWDRRLSVSWCARSWCLNVPGGGDLDHLRQRRSAAVVHASSGGTYMRKTFLILLIVVSAGLLAASIIYFEKLQQSRLDYAALQASEAETKSRYGAAIDEIAAIQDSLNTIVLGDEGMRMLKTQLASEESLSPTGGDEALARIAVLRAGIERTKTRIEELDQRLRKSGVRIAGLERMITNLKQTVREKEAEVAELTSRVDELNTKVTGLVAEVQQGQQRIEDQEETIEAGRRALSTVYYTIGSRHELSEAGVIVGRGGVLGFGKTYQPSGQFQDGSFTPLDTDLQTTISIHAENVKVITSQPPNSYELTRVGDETQLHILDPEAFRSVKHVVIMTT